MIPWYIKFQSNFYSYWEMTMEGIESRSQGNGWEIQTKNGWERLFFGCIIYKNINNEFNICTENEFKELNK